MSDKYPRDRVTSGGQESRRATRSYCPETYDDGDISYFGVKGGVKNRTTQMFSQSALGKFRTRTSSDLTGKQNNKQMSLCLQQTFVPVVWTERTFPELRR